MKRVFVPYNVAAQYLQMADVLSYRLGPPEWNPLTWPGYLMSRAISICGRNPDVHTGMVDRNTDGEFMALGMRLGSQKLLYLANEVAAYPNLIDVYRPCPMPVPPWEDAHKAAGFSHPVRRRICDQMRRFALNDHYGWWDVVRSGYYFAIGVRWLVPHHEEIAGEEPARPFCTQAVSHSIRRQQMPAMLNRPDRMILPGEFVTSPLLAYLFTLALPDETPGKIEHYLAGANP